MNDFLTAMGVDPKTSRILAEQEVLRRSAANHGWLTDDEQRTATKCEQALKKIHSQRERTQRIELAWLKTWNSVKHLWPQG